MASNSISPDRIFYNIETENCHVGTPFNLAKIGKMEQRLLLYCLYFEQNAPQLQGYYFLELMA